RKQDDDHAEGFHGVDVDTLRGFLAIDSDAHEIIEVEYSPPVDVESATSGLIITM
ncbi:hypothetical protein DYB31_014660, partial [Aphanomyces astaci]